MVFQKLFIWAFKYESGPLEAIVRWMWRQSMLPLYETRWFLGASFQRNSFPSEKYKLSMIANELPAFN